MSGLLSLVKYNFYQLIEINHVILKIRMCNNKLVLSEYLKNLQYIAIIEYQNTHCHLISKKKKDFSS